MGHLIVLGVDLVLGFGWGGGEGLRGGFGKVLGRWGLTLRGVRTLRATPCARPTRSLVAPFPEEDGRATDATARTDAAMTLVAHAGILNCELQK